MKTFLLAILVAGATIFTGCSGVEATFTESVIPGAYQKCIANSGLKRIDILAAGSTGFTEPYNEEGVRLRVHCHNGATFTYEEYYRGGVKVDEH